MPSPFLYITAALASGIAIFSILPVPLYFIVGTLCIVSFFAWAAFFSKKQNLVFGSVLLIFFLLGGSYHMFQSRKYEENPLRTLPSGASVDVFGRIKKSPSRGYDRDFLFISVEKIRWQNREYLWQGSMRIAVLQTPESASVRNLLVGDRVEAAAQIGSLEGFRNFSPDIGKSYLKTRRIHQTAYTKSPLMVRKISQGKPLSVGRLISRLRLDIVSRIESSFQDNSLSISPAGSVLEALLLGERGRLPEPLTRALQKSGIFHLFAISGAHIGIITFFLFFFMGLFRIPRRVRYSLLIPALLLFAFLVEGRPSVFRATIMTLTFLLGKIFWKDTNLLNILAVSAFLLLLANPFDLFSAGFQLTYAATLAIILFFPKVNRYLPRAPFRLSEILAISVTAQLGVIPIMAAVFNRVTFASLFLNFAALPLVALIMVLGWLFLGLSLVYAPAAAAAAAIINHIIGWLTGLSHLFDGLSFMSYRIPNPPVWVIIGYYLSLAALLLPIKIRRFRPVKALFFLIFLLITITHPFPSHSKHLRLTFIDVGQGESILIEFPGHKKMLIDGGGFNTGRFDVGESVVSPFLWRRGIKTIHILALTHAHPDHVKGLVAVSRNFNIAEFWDALPPVDNPDYKDLEKSLKPDTAHRRCSTGFRTDIGGVRIEALHPPPGEKPAPQVENDQSLVLKLTYGETSFLLTGDIGSAVEERLLEEGRDIRADVLKVAHHGSRTSSSAAFLEKSAPQIAVISAGRGNVFGLPAPSVIQRFRDLGTRIFRTDLHGAVEITSDGKTLHIREAVKEPH